MSLSWLTRKLVYRILFAALLLWILLGIFAPYQIAAWTLGVEWPTRSQARGVQALMMVPIALPLAIAGMIWKRNEARVFDTPPVYRPDAPGFTDSAHARRLDNRAPRVD